MLQRNSQQTHTHTHTRMKTFTTGAPSQDGTENRAVVTEKTL